MAFLSSIRRVSERALECTHSFASPREHTRVTITHTSYTPVALLPPLPCFPARYRQCRDVPEVCRRCWGWERHCCLGTVECADGWARPREGRASIEWWRWGYWYNIHSPNRSAKCRGRWRARATWAMARQRSTTSARPSHSRLLARRSCSTSPHHLPSSNVIRQQLGSMQQVECQVALCTKCRAIIATLLLLLPLLSCPTAGPQRRGAGSTNTCITLSTLVATLRLPPRTLPRETAEYALGVHPSSFP